MMNARFVALLAVAALLVASEYSWLNVTKLIVF